MTRKEKLREILLGLSTWGDSLLNDVCKKEVDQAISQIEELYRCDEVKISQLIHKVRVQDNFALDTWGEDELAKTIADYCKFMAETLYNIEDKENVL